MKSFLPIIFLLTSLASSAQTWDETLYKKIEESIQQPNIRINHEIDIRDYGASPEASAAHNQKSIQKAIDRCAKKGGGKVIIPSGLKFRTGAIELKSSVNLHI